jgi:starvation-inducible DNA-binding protein
MERLTRLSHPLARRDAGGFMNTHAAPLATPTDLGTAASRDIDGAMNAILADVFALPMKTKNISGPRRRNT